MNNSDYWKQRFEQLENAQNALGEKTRSEIEKLYDDTLEQLEAKIILWYQRLADNNGISMAEARRWLKGSELKEFKWTVDKYIKYGKENALNQKWVKELENASARHHISRLESLKILTQQSFETLFANQQNAVHKAFSDIYKSGYFHTAYEVQKFFNVGWDIAGLDQAQIEKVLSKPWAVDGYNFSERIWRNKDRLISEVHRDLSQNILLGADPQKAIDSLAKKMNTSKYNAGRLVMTEEAYFSSAAQKDCFDDLGVEQYEIVATLDSHTSKICRRLDGKVFPMSDYQAGVTAPPFHVYCRSTTAPYFDDEFDIGERAARDKDGNIYYVPADMKYSEWEKTFADGGSKEGLETVDKSGGSGIIKMGKTKGKVYTQTPPDFSKYKIDENLKGVEEIKSYIIDTLGINENDVRLDGIRNVSVLKPFIEQVKKIQQQTGFTLPNINAVDLIDGDSCCIAGYKPMENRFYISSWYFNSKEALLDTLKDWSANGILPKQGKSIRYLAEHESAHMRIPDEILNSDEAKEIHKTFLRSKSYNDNGVQIAEFFADSLAIYRMNQTTTDNNVIKVIEYLRKEGVL